MNDDDRLLADIPEFMSVDMMLKASPSEESGGRFLYFEASNEDPDYQDEVILQKALEASSDYYLRHGNIDLCHYTLIGAKAGIPNYMDFEIGRPVAVQVDGSRTFVKAELYQGDSAMAQNANRVWASLTQQTPRASWFASVGGAVLSKSIKTDPETQAKVAVVDRVRWSNTALDRTPVNKTVGHVSAAPIGTFAKSLNGFVFQKSLAAGHESNVAGMTGGSALRVQSLDGAPQSYFDFRDLLSGALSSREAKIQTKDGLVAFSVKNFKLSADEATEWVDRFLCDLKRNLTKRSLQ